MEQREQARHSVDTPLFGPEVGPPTVGATAVG